MNLPLVATPRFFAQDAANPLDDRPPPLRAFTRKLEGDGIPVSQGTRQGRPLPSFRLPPAIR